MGISVSVDLSAPAKEPSYSVEYSGPFMIVRGSIPLDKLGGLLKKRKKEIMSIYLAKKHGACFFVGPEKDIAALTDSMMKADKDNFQMMIESGAGPLDAWIKYGEVGASSLFMALYLSGDPGREVPRVSTPIDMDDFSRCEKMLDLIPSFRARLSNLSMVQQYKGLVEHWEQLRSLYLEYEANKSSVTYRTFQTLLDAALAQGRKTGT